MEFIVGVGSILITKKICIPEINLDPTLASPA